jgi:hypothetical protein
LKGRVGLTGSAGSIPHDSSVIFIGCHGHASRPRDRDPQRLRPRAGCLKFGDRRGYTPLRPRPCDPAGADRRGSSVWSRYQQRRPVAKKLSRTQFLSREGTLIGNGKSFVINLAQVHSRDASAPLPLDRIEHLKQTGFILLAVFQHQFHLRVWRWKQRYAGAKQSRVDGETQLVD